MNLMVSSLSVLRLPCHQPHFLLLRFIVFYLSLSLSPATRLHHRPPHRLARSWPCPRWSHSISYVCDLDAIASRPVFRHVLSLRASPLGYALGSLYFSSLCLHLPRFSRNAPFTSWRTTLRPALPPTSVGRKSP